MAVVTAVLWLKVRVRYFRILRNVLSYIVICIVDKCDSPTVARPTSRFIPFRIASFRRPKVSGAMWNRH